MGTPYETDTIVWADSLAQAVNETGLDLFPDDCPWTMEQVLSQAFLPD